MIAHPPVDRNGHATPDEQELAAIQCPFRRARAITQIARDRNNLPAPLAALRTAALREARPRTSSITALAAAVDMSRSRVSTLINNPPEAPAHRGR